MDYSTSKSAKDYSPNFDGGSITVAIIGAIGFISVMWLPMLRAEGDNLARSDAAAILRMWHGEDTIGFSIALIAFAGVVLGAILIPEGRGIRPWVCGLLSLIALWLPASLLLMTGEDWWSGDSERLVRVADFAWGLWLASVAAVLGTICSFVLD